MHQMSCKHSCFVRKCPLICSNVMARCSSRAELNLYRSDIISCALQLYFENCGVRNWWQLRPDNCRWWNIRPFVPPGWIFSVMSERPENLVGFSRAANMLWINEMIADIIFAGRHVVCSKRAAEVTAELWPQPWCWLDFDPATRVSAQTGFVLVVRLHDQVSESTWESW